MTYPHFDAGDAFEPSARMFNELVDMITAWRNGEFGDQDGEGQDNDDLRIVNEVGDLEAFSVLGIENPFHDPTVEPTRFKYNPALRGVEPDTAKHTGKFAVTQSGSKQGDMPVCIQSGLTPCKVQFFNVDHEFCDCDQGITDRLRSKADGTARIIWKPADITIYNTYDCLVDLGGGGGGSIALIVAQLLYDLGTNDPGVQCSLRNVLFGNPPNEVGDTINVRNSIEIFDGSAGNYCLALLRNDQASTQYEMIQKPCGSTVNHNDPPVGGFNNFRVGWDSDQITLDQDTWGFDSTAAVFEDL